MNGDDQLSFDVRRTVLLGAYMQAWGMPQSRIVATRGSENVEVYFFPAEGQGKVNRFATVGISSLPADGTKTIDWEIFMATPTDNAGASREEVTAFILDLMAFSLRDDVQFDVGTAIDETPLAPQSWKARAILIDEPRAEPESLAVIHVGSQCVKLLWMVPIHKSEYEAIMRDGIDVFDKAEAVAEWSPADPLRDSYL